MAKSLKDGPQENEIDEDLIRKLAALLDETGLSEIDYRNNGLSIRVAKQFTMNQVEPTLKQSEPPVLIAPATEPDFSSHPGAVVAPMVGVAFIRPDPTSSPFIKVGDKVTKGQTLFLIEAMKVFNPITSPRDGRIERIFIENETPVEYGEPLAIIE